MSDGKRPRLRLSLDADTSGRETPPSTSRQCRREAPDNRMIHSLSKEVTASCAFYGWNLGFPQCKRRRAPSQAPRLAYRISRAADKEQKPPHSSLSRTEMCLMSEFRSNFTHLIMERHSRRRNRLHIKGRDVKVKWWRSSPASLLLITGQECEGAELLISDCS